ncbi:ArdC family protein [Hymenobacter glacieicola]|uniref:DNA primase n=1 Tax=Hymenobacter glacieicola TaxID=1562124 RepID=A0ABQ1X4Q7_9BACT|nr:zincin-like metallopeptidase domain-containing protein [Hymenobacter glacieicola]GGG59862.1 DNA primase [Hymenobacter glacieicola]
MEAATTFAPRADVQEIITNRIIMALENGVTPWKKPWNAASGAPRNYRSKHVYTGINALLLGMLPYEQAYYLTYKQAQELGGQVRRGEKGMPVVFWKVTKKEDAEGNEKKSAYLQCSTVFNVAQIDGIEWKFPEVPSREHTPQQAAEQIIAGYVGGPRIQYSDSEAYYRTSTDTVTMPEASSFHTAEDFYLTTFHELVHSTGHSKRLDRATLTEKAAFGSPTYAKEELVAELGAAFLSNTAGLDLSVTESNTASYVESWLQALRNDKTLIISAASQAQKALNHILGVVPSYEASEAE